MANFSTHLAVGAAVSGIATTSFLGAGMATPEEAGLYFAAGTVGSLLPDLDHDESYILKMFFVFLGVGISSWIVWAWFIRAWSFLEIFLVWMAFFLTIYFGVYSIFASATKHRGLFHSVPAAFFAWALITFIAFKGFRYGALVSWMIGFFVWLGYLTHLILDEIFAVNIMNASLKRSWGTAFKFYGPNSNMFLTVFLYVAAILLFWFGPRITPFWNTLFGPKYYSTWSGQFMPRGGWFMYRPGPPLNPANPPPRSERDPDIPDRYRDLR